MTRSLASTSSVSTTHTSVIAAPAAAVFRLIVEAEHWPYLFPQVVHVERLSGSPTQERLRLWTSVNGAVGSWVSQRTLDREGMRIRFRQEAPSDPVAAMSGEWIVIPLPGNATSVVLLHEFRTAADTPGEAALIRQAVDRNSTAELAALRATAELGDRLPGLVHSFADSVLIKAPLAPVYDFLHRAADWPAQVPHISRLALDEAVQNVQTLEMESIGPDGTADTIRLLRVCFPAHRIVYKQTAPNPALRAHVGEWRLQVTADGVRATALNTVVVAPEALAGPRPERPPGRHLRSVPGQYGRSGQIRPAPPLPEDPAHAARPGAGQPGLRAVPVRPALHGLPAAGSPLRPVRPGLPGGRLGPGHAGLPARPAPGAPGQANQPGFPGQPGQSGQQGYPGQPGRAGVGSVRDPRYPGRPRPGRVDGAGAIVPLGRAGGDRPAEPTSDLPPDPVVEKIRAALRHHCTAILLHAKEAAEGRAAVR